MRIRPVRLITIALAAALLLPLVPAGAFAADGPPAGQIRQLPGNFVKAAENGRFVLYSDPAEAEIALADKQEGRVWRSNPPDRAADETAKGVFRMLLSSQISVRYVDERTTLFNATSKVNSVDAGAATYTIVPDGIEFVFDFPKEQFRIPVRYTLADDHLKAEIAAGRIEEYGTNKIVSIVLLPFFGAGSTQDEGYMVVPDGSGALIRFNNGKRFAAEYAQPVYGIDHNYDRAIVDSFTEQARLPVFGMRSGDGGFVAVLAQGEAAGIVRATVSGKTTSYNQVYSEFQYRSMGSMSLTQKNFQSRDINIVERNKADQESFEVRYYFLDSGHADYAAMAGIYRDYLLEEQHVRPVVQEGDIPFYLDLYGFVKKRKTFLGIPYKKVVPLTTFEDAGQIVSELREGGVPLPVVRYTGWIHDSFLQKVPSSAAAEKKLGGQKGLTRLSDALQKLGGELFLNTDFLNIYETGNGFSRFRHAAMTIVNFPAMQYAYNVNIYSKDSAVNPWYLLAPQSLFKFVGKFLQSFDKLKGIAYMALADIGTKVYSDLGLNGISKAQTPAKYEEAMSEAQSRAGKLMTDGGNAYVIPYSQHIINAPAYSSEYDITDETIPIYQIVLHGIVPYSGPPVNLSSSPQTERLRSLETGSYPLYAWIARNTKELKNTRLDYLYSADYGNWIDFAVRDYNEINGVLSKVAAQTIIGHRKLSEGVYETTYEQGTRIIVNYNESDATADGVRVAGLGYAVLEGGARR